uniref:Ovule protein n=1 Tax=Ascaris lumbricoides TaxID=6252 RepID=A0A0M3HI86_ASCLU
MCMELNESRKWDADRARQESKWRGCGWSSKGVEVEGMRMELKTISKTSEIQIKEKRCQIRHPFDIFDFLSISISSRITLELLNSIKR